MQADQRGKAVISAEMGESNRVTEPFVHTGIAGLHSVMRAIGMEDGEPQVVEHRKLSTIHVVHAEQGGGLRLSVSLGDEVEKGAAIASVCDAFGEVVEEIHAPHDGVVLRVMLRSSITTGAEVFWIAS